MVAVERRWPGETVICLGSGPSLTREDVEYCRGKARVIAINSTYELAPFADVLYGADRAWWRWHDGAPSFAGLKYTLSQEKRSRHHWPDVMELTPVFGSGLETDPSRIKTGPPVQANSGYQAINLAVHLGAARIVLLGYDMQRGATGAHWHGDHPNRIGSPYRDFQKAFPTLVQPLEQLGIAIVNCSRTTALTCFPCRPLADVLSLAVAA